MNHDIMTQLQSRMANFSKGQKRIARLILEEYDKTAFLTASALGQRAGVSESTVVRFAAELGFEGYPQMQKAMQETVLNRLTNVQRLGVAHERMADRDVVSAVLHADAEKIRKTEQILDRKAFDRAVKAILQARRIYVIGVRSAAPLAGSLGHYLNYMFDNVHVLTSSGAGEIFEKLMNVNSTDTVVAFSFPRYSASTLKAAAYCRNVGATVIGITNSGQSPLSDSCDCVLTAQSDMASFVDSLVAPMSLVNALIVALSQSREEALQNNFEKLEHIWEEYHVYEKQG